MASWLQANGRLSLLLATYTLALAPFAANYLSFHPDERHYVDGGLDMVQSGDWLTPRTPDGELRFNKPVLTYWLVALPYQTFGLSPLASRCLFLTCSLAIVAMVYQLAMLLLASQEKALIAAALVATHVPLLGIATSSLPDVPLVLVVLMASYGFMAILLRDRRDARFYWMAWIGVGLGIAIKGLPIAMLVVYAVLFARFNPWRRVSLRELVHLPSMLCGIALAAWWYVAMFSMHGEQALVMFIGDQVTDRVTFSLGKTIRHFAASLLACVTAFSPWSLPLLLKLKRTLKLARESDLQLFAFVFGWTLMVALATAFVERWAMRYMLLATPLLAIAVADLTSRLDPNVVRKFRGRMATCLVGLTVALAVIVVAVRSQLHAGLLGTTCVMAIVVLAMSLLRRPQSIERLASAALLLGPLAFLALSPLALPDSGEMLASGLDRSKHLLRDNSISYVGNPALASKTRLALRGELQLEAINQIDDLSVPDLEMVLVKSHEMTKEHQQNYVAIGLFNAGISSLSPGPLFSALVRGKLRDYVYDRRQRLSLLVRHDVFYRDSADTEWIADTGHSD